MTSTVTSFAQFDVVITKIILLVFLRHGLYRLYRVTDLLTGLKQSSHLIIRISWWRWKVLEESMLCFADYIIIKRNDVI